MAEWVWAERALRENTLDIHALSVTGQKEKSEKVNCPAVDAAAADLEHWLDLTAIEASNKLSVDGEHNTHTNMGTPLQWKHYLLEARGKKKKKDGQWKRRKALALTVCMNNRHQQQRWH